MKPLFTVAGIPLPLPESLAELSQLAPSLIRGGRGLIAFQPAREPAQPLELYEFEACPYCRKVRDTLTELDLGYISRAAAPGTDRGRVLALGGKVRFPFLVDPNTQSALYESEDIIDHLHRTYGRPRPAWRRALAPIDTLSSALASAARPRGARAQLRTTQPAQLLELWSFEASPFCRKVREVLSELGLDYRVHNVGKRGRRRPELVALGGQMQVPYLVDPNTGAALYESDEIIAYLRQTYP